MQVKSTVKFDWGAIRQLETAQITALEQTAEYLPTEVGQAQVMPFDTGAMQGDKTVTAGERSVIKYPDGSEAVNEITKADGGKVSIITTSPQVRRLYYHPEDHFQKHENPNARGKWYADWLPGGSREKDCQKAYAQFYKRLTGV